MSEQGGLTGCATPQHGEKNKREAVRKEKGIKMTAKELNLAARTVFAEAATEGLNGQMAVAQTMYDQLYHNIIGADGSGFGKTLEEVIQNAYTTPTEQDIRGSSCLEAVIRVFLEGQRIFTDHYVYFFMSDRGSSYWRNYWDTHYVNMGKLKNHTFWGVAIPDDQKTQPFARYVAEVNDPDGWTFVYEEAGKDSEFLKNYPRLNNGNLVEVLGNQKGSDGAVWNLISIAGAYAGYVRADLLKRK